MAHVKVVPKVTNVSLQVADVTIVSVDTRGFDLATKLARRGWKTVVIELSGSVFVDRDWSDRLGPFLAWQMGSSDQNDFAALWLASGPVAFGGHLKVAGERHLKMRYGASAQTSKDLTREGGWPQAMARSLVASHLESRDTWQSQANSGLKLQLDQPVTSKVSAEAVASERRELAQAAGVRILDAEQIVAVRVSDDRIDRIEFQARDGLHTERTRSLVWMLSEEESNRDEFVRSDVPFGRVFEPGASEPLMAWWRSRLAVTGTLRAKSLALKRVPFTPPFVIVVGSIERPWSHDNLVVLALVEETPEMKVYDVWTRIPYWSRSDHVYRDEHRLHTQRFLADRLVGCELTWVTPSPLALTEPAIRMPHIIYSETSIAARGRLENVLFAGPETWPGVGLLGIAPMQDEWINRLEAMRIQWDPVARLQATRMQKIKFAFKKFARRRNEPEENSL